MYHKILRLALIVMLFAVPVQADDMTMLVVIPASGILFLGIIVTLIFSGLAVATKLSKKHFIKILVASSIITGLPGLLTSIISINYISSQHRYLSLCYLIFFFVYSVIVFMGFKIVSKKLREENSNKDSLITQDVVSPEDSAEKTNKYAVCAGISFVSYVAIGFVIPPIICSFPELIERTLFLMVNAIVHIILLTISLVASIIAIFIRDARKCKWIGYVVLFVIIVQLAFRGWFIFANFR